MKVTSPVLYRGFDGVGRRAWISGGQAYICRSFLNRHLEAAGAESIQIQVSNRNPRDPEALERYAMREPNVAYYGGTDKPDGNWHDIYPALHRLIKPLMPEDKPTKLWLVVYIPEGVKR